MSVKLPDCLRRRVSHDGSVLREQVEKKQTLQTILEGLIF